MFDADFKFEEFSTDITRALVAMRDVSFCFHICFLFFLVMFVKNVANIKKFLYIMHIENGFCL